MFSASESESEPGISMEQVVSRALKASPTKKTDFKTVSKTGNKSKASRSLLDLVEDGELLLNTFVPLSDLKVFSKAIGKQYQYFLSYKINLCKNIYPK